MTGFACIWIRLAALCLITYGAAIVGVAVARNDALLVAALSIDFPDNLAHLAGAMPQLWFAVGGIGAAAAGWGAMLYFIAKYPLARGEAWAWHACALSIGIWFVLDTVLSVALGALGNVPVNLAILAVFAAPLALLRLTPQARTSTARA